jgi:ferredoxin
MIQGRQMKKIIHFLRKRCDFCGTCVAVCPEDAIELFESDLAIIRERCTLCRNCVHICPVRALEVANDGSL